MRAKSSPFSAPSLFSSFHAAFRRAFRILPVLLLLSMAGQAAVAQGTSLADASVPKVIAPSVSSPQFFVLNADGSLMGFSTLNSSSYTLSCNPPSGMSTSEGTSLTLADDGRALTTFQTGQSNSGSPAAVGRGTPLSGSGCTDSAPLAVGGGAVSVLLSAEDPAHQRLFVVSSGGSAADTLTSFSTANVKFNSTSEALSKLGQVNLSKGGVYSSLLTDVDGSNGDTIITEERTDSNPGGLWFYDSTYNLLTQVFGPDGAALPAIGAFILHNPTDGGGSLLVLVNQDGLTSANLNSPPIDTTPFTIIDLGQLHDLIGQSNSPSTIMLPSVVTINSSLGFYAMLGAAYNPVNHLLYAVVGGGTSTTDVYREVVSYDPSDPSSPAETVVADVSSIPLTSSLNTQLALNGAAGSMQILAKDAGKVYTAPITGTGETASEVLSSTFPDSNYLPTYIASNPLLGETYIASASQVDILTRPTANKMQLTLDLTGPEMQTAVGNDSSIYLLVDSPDEFDYGLSTTNVTITATPQAGGSPFTFATAAAALAVGFPTAMSGSFPKAGIYTLVASFPGDSLFAPAVSGPVEVAVAQALFATTTSVVGKIDNTTGAGKALVTVTGTNYTPTGTIKITSVDTDSTIATYTLSGPGAISGPITIAFTAPPSTTAIQAAYSGDMLNQASESAATTLTVGKSITLTLSVSSSSTGVVGLDVPLSVVFTSSSKTAPTGNIIVSASSGTSTFITIATIPASQAFAAGGTTVHWTPSAAGTYSTSVYYAGDYNYDSAFANGQSIDIAAAGAVSLVLSSPTTATQGTAFNVGVKLSPTDALVTGNITVTAIKSGSTTPVTVGTISAATAALSSGALLPVTFTSPGAYTLSASYPGDTHYGAATSNNMPIVTVTGGTSAAATLTPTSGSFTANAGATTPYQNFVLYSTGGSALTISKIAITGSGFAQINGCPSSLAAGTNCTIRVNFSPVSAGNVSGSVTVSDNASDSPQRIALTGVGIASAAVVSPATVAFIDQTIGTSSFAQPGLKLKNAGQTSFTVNSVTLSNTTDFELRGSTCSAGAVIAPSASCSVSLVFHPGTAGAKTATVSFSTSNSSVAQTVSATGTGLAAGKCVDSDGDGLCDDWELNGVWVRVPGKPDQFIDLPSMGANYLHKDIFIQADYMGTAAIPVGEHSHQMNLDALKIDIAAFANAPVMNKDGTTGIRLHVDCGFNCIMDPVKNTIWGNASQATEIVEQTDLDSAAFSKTVPFDWTLFDSDSTAFAASGRSLVFHHVIFAHDQNPGYTSSGISRNAATFPDFQKGASDFVVSLGSWTNSTGTAMQQAGTLMHELGHNLGLGHGGGDGTNYKPNYLSVMNYNFQTGGLIINGTPGTFDYSRFNLPTMNETQLNEQKGLNIDPTAYPGTSSSFPSIDKYGTWWFCPGTNPTTGSAVGVTSVNGKTNWDCDPKKTYSQTLVSVDTNADGALSLLPSYKDWPALVFSGGAIGGNGIGSTPLMQTLADEITMEQDSLIKQTYSVAITGMGGVHTAPGSTITLSFIITNKGTNPDTYTLTASTLHGWATAPGTPATLVLGAGAMSTVTVTYSVPTTALTGDSDQLTLKAVSQAAPNVLDAKVVLVYATTSPAPAAISVATVVFGAQNVGSTGPTGAVVITNTGTSPLSLGGFATTAEFAQTTTCGATLALGASCSVNVTFTPAATGDRTGTLTFNAGGPVTVTLRGTAVTPSLPLPENTLTITPPKTSTGQPVTLIANLAAVPSGKVPTGTVTFVNGTSQIGKATLDSSGNASFTSSTLGAGAYNVIAQYSGDSSYGAANSPYEALAIATATPTTATLTTSAATVVLGSGVTFTATLGGGTSGAQPTGSVTFFDATTLLGAGTLNASGVATYTTSSLAAGTHSITAVYAGDATFAASTSAALLETVVVTVPDFSVVPNPASLTITSGASGIVTFTVTPTNGYAGSINFSCGSLPAYASCVFAPAKLTFVAAAQTAQSTTLTIATTQNQAALNPMKLQKEGRGSPFALALILPLALLGLRGRRGNSFFIRSLLFQIVLGGGLVAMSGCGGMSKAAQPSTSAGSYNISITITDGTSDHSMTYALTVK